VNTIACKDCAHFDQQYKYKGSKRLASWYGWCRKRSEYPAHEWDPAQPFDVDVKRVSQGADRSKPFIVDANGIQTSCSVAVKNT
jgi:hypothetical protein